MCAKLWSKIFTTAIILVEWKYVTRANERRAKRETKILDR